MSEGNDLEALRELGSYLEDHFGWRVSETDLTTVSARLKPLLPRLGSESFAELNRLVHSRRHEVLPQLICATTIGESYFLRERAQFEALRDIILPRILRHLSPAEPLTIWSAGCATGEEPYSFAMYLSEYAPELFPRRVRIVGTDINPDYLDQARLGRYRKWSFRRSEPHWRQRYFTEDGDCFVIAERVRNSVTFQEHNLASGVLPDTIQPGKTAIIACRNVLIYFAPHMSPRVLELAARALMPRGVLLLGHADYATPGEAWHADYHRGTFFYRLATTNGDPERSGGCLDVRRKIATVRRERRPRKASKPEVCKREEPPETTRKPRPAMPTSLMSIEELLAQARGAADEGRLAEARQLLDEVMVRERVSPEAYVLSALVDEQLGDSEAARSALKKALFLDKSLVVGHYLLAVWDEREGDQTAAMRRYRSVGRLLADVPANRELPFAGGLSAGRMLEIVEVRAAELAERS